MRSSSSRRLPESLRAALLACTAGGLAACTIAREPAFDDLFPQASVAREQPLIVIPGLLGSRLGDPESGARLWPPKLGMLLRGWSTRRLALPSLRDGEDPWAPTGFVLAGPGRDYYASLLDTLEAVGYECVPQRALSAQTNCVLFAWDWRRGFVAASAALQDVVERLRGLHGDPDLTVDLVAHSAGALVARYYTRYGGTNVIDTAADSPAVPAPAVRRAILIGPPNDGSLYSVHGLVRGYRVGVFNVPPEVLATFDTSYQLLPHPETEWLLDRRGRLVDRSLYDVETWREFRMSIFDPEIRERVVARADSSIEGRERLEVLEEQFRRGLARAQRFHEALTAPLAQEARVEYVVLGSDCELTPRRFLLERAGGEALVRLRPEEIVEPLAGVDYEALMLEPGDGRVTRSSMLRQGLPSPGDLQPPLDIRNVMFTCERHSEMASNFEVRHNLLNFLFQ